MAVEEENTVELLQKEKEALNNNKEIYHETVVRKKTISPLRRLTPQVRFSCLDVCGKKCAKIRIFSPSSFFLDHCCDNKKSNYCE